jgi:hypothetical protein
MDMPNPVSPAAIALTDVASLATNAQARAALDNLRITLPDLFAALVKKINVAQVLAKSGKVGEVSVGEISIGDVVVDKVTLTDTSANLKSGSAFLQNVDMTLELKFKMHWWYDIGIYSDSGDENLGSLGFAMNIGNVQVPSLEDIQLEIPSVSVNNLNAQFSPIKNLNLGAAGFTKLKVDDTTLPSAGFTLNGLATGALTLSGLGAPEVSSAKASIDEFKPAQTVVLPGAKLTGLAIPSTAIPNVSSGDFGLDAQASSRSISVDFGIFGFTFIVTPVVHMRIGAMTLQSLSLSANVDQAAVENVRLPVSVRSILLKSLKLEDVSVTNVSL